MPSADQPREEPWWMRRVPSIAVLIVVLLIMGGTALVLGNEVSHALPDVGRDKIGDDPWVDPVGLESVHGFEIAHIPDCAVGSVARIDLWDQVGHPYWSVAGPPSSLKVFSVGALPPGFHTVTPFTAPPKGATLWLVVIRKGRPAIGIRYTQAELVANRVVSGKPLKRFTVAGYQTAAVCASTTAGVVSLAPGAAGSKAGG